MYRFEKLEIWQMANNYCFKIYRLTDDFPKAELFCLTSQLRRAGISIPSNIAEGSGSSTMRDFCHYLDISIKSTLETVSQLVIAKRLGYLTKEQYQELYSDSEILVKKMRAFKSYLKTPHPPRSTPQPEMEEIYDQV